jgi:cell division protein YceG involved in septum cleavage
LFPANVPYRYFVAHPDGHHEFTQTFEEHKAAAAKIRRDQRNRTPARR